MTTLAIESSTIAATRARANLETNLAALDATQPDLVKHVTAIDADDSLEWVLGRDRSLTARTAEGRWWADCSLPQRAAMAQLRRMDVTGPVACFLLPTTAAAVAVALAKLRPGQAIIAIVPEATSLRVMLSCHDFSGDIAAHRIWFLGGENWPAALGELFDRNPGLSIPTQFIRLTSSDANQIEQAIVAAQRALSDLTTRRAQQMRTARDGWKRKTTRTPRLCIVAPLQFRLWNDWGAILRDACAGDPHCLIVDSDDPISASPLAVAQRAAECDAIVTIDTFRQDAPGVAPESMPWITWATGTRIPPRAAAGAKDRIVLLEEPDRARAVSLGWAASELRVAQPQADEVAAAAQAGVAIIADTARLDPPASIDDYSSQRPLWEYIADELARDPFAIGDDPDRYLTARMRRFDVAEQTLNRAAFLHSLIVPAHQQGLARLLIATNLPLRIAGRGWCEIPHFSSCATGLIQSRQDLADVIARSAVLVHVQPDRRTHAIDFAGRPVIRARSNRDRFVRDLRDALQNPAAAKKTSANLTIPTSSAVITPDLLRQLVT